MDDDLRDAFDRRAGRSAPRGADDVWRAARADADRPRRVRPPLGLPIGLTSLAVALIAAGLAIGADDDDHDPSTTPSGPSAPEIVIAQNASALVSYGGCTALLDDLKEQALDRVGPYGLGTMYPFYGREFFGGGTGASGGVPLAPDVKVVQTRDASRSRTNTQEEGIDEPDLVETDGARLFDVRDGELRVVDIARAEVTATIELGLLNVHGATLIGDRLVVFANEPLSGGGSLSEAKVVVVDVEDQPEVHQRLTIDGVLVDARVADRRVHLVTVSAPSLQLTYAMGWGSTSDKDAATEANKERIRSSTLADWLPSRVVTDATGDLVAERAQLTDCAAVRHPKEFGGFDQTSLVTLDLDDLARTTSTSVQASSLLVYGSAENLYTTTSTYQDIDARTGAVRPLPADGGTDVHRFALGDVPTYAGSGRVAGYVGDQFGLSEHDGHLRVASTTFEGGGKNRVTVLRIDDGELVETGVVDGLGPNEQIEGVRFVGDLGYVVTFRQTDPLYVIDLRDPKAPVLAGELKIPGYSAYLHPVGDGLLLGVGFDGTEAGATRDTAASLFDVSDPANPQRVDLEVFEGRSPKTAEDHHAFTWWEESSTAYFPAGMPSGHQVVEVVRVADGQLIVDGELRPVGEGAPPRAAFDRIVVVGDQLLLVSPEGVQVSDRGSLEPIDWIDYP